MVYVISFFLWKLPIGILKFSLGNKVGRILTVLLIMGILVLNATNYLGTGKYDHTIPKHAEDGKLSNWCFDNLGTHLTVSEEDRRWVNFCKLPDGRVAVKVIICINGVKETITGYMLKGNFTDQELISIAEEEMGKYGFFSYVAPFLRELMTSVFK